MAGMGVLLLSLCWSVTLLVCHFVGLSLCWSVTALLLSSLNSLVHSLRFERK
jgi:hypothetical protein